MISKSRVWLLAGLISLPAMASPTLEWEFAGTRYHVEQEGKQVRVAASRHVALSSQQMKAVCRKGLGLPLRAHYEQQLVAQKYITKPLMDWPIAGLAYELSDLKFLSVSSNDVTCSATVTDSGEKTNLATTALSYAVGYYGSNQPSAIKPMLPYLMKQPVVSMDAAGLISLLLSQGDNAKAQAYFDQYVDITTIKTDSIKQWLAQWQFEQAQYETAAFIAQQCKSPSCQQLSLAIDEAIAEQAQETAGDLSSYF